MMSRMENIPESGTEKERRVVISTEGEQIEMTGEQEYEGFAVGQRLSIIRATQEMQDEWIAAKKRPPEWHASIPARAQSSSDIYVAGFTDKRSDGTSYPEKRIVLMVDSTATPPNGHVVYSPEVLRARFRKSEKTTPHIGNTEYA